MQYKEQYKHPKWQKKRLEIMERDGFQCQACFSRKKTLTVHHKCFFANTEIWNYDDDCFITLCENCHEDYRLNNNYIGLFDFYQWLLDLRIKQIDSRTDKIGYKIAIDLLTAFIIK